MCWFISLFKRKSKKENDYLTFNDIEILDNEIYDEDDFDDDFDDISYSIDEF